MMTPLLEVVPQCKLHNSGSTLGRGKFSEAGWGSSVLRGKPDAGFVERSGEDGGVGEVKDFPFETKLVGFAPRHFELLLQAHIDYKIRRKSYLISISGLPRMWTSET